MVHVFEFERECESPGRLGNELGGLWNKSGFYDNFSSEMLKEDREFKWQLSKYRWIESVINEFDFGNRRFNLDFACFLSS